jgi:hypothetical protein
MLEIIVVLLIFLWLTGNLIIPGLVLPDVSLFVINGQTITLWDLIILALVAWAIGILPSPFRQIAGLLLVLWLLSVLGFLSLAGISLSGVILIAIILGILASLFSRARLP